MLSRGERVVLLPVSRVFGAVVLTGRVRVRSETCVAVDDDSLLLVHGADGTERLTGTSADMLSSPLSQRPASRPSL